MTQMQPQEPVNLMARGKRQLIDAALRLAAQGGSLSSLGLRELAREAGLNHNTFYRHFRDTEELGAAAVYEIAQQVMAGVKQIRAHAARHADATVGTAKYFYEFVLKNPQPFIVGLRELHSVSTPMRAVLKQVLDDIAVESVEQIVSMNLAPGLSDTALLQATSAITYYLFYRSLDYLEQPQARKALIEQTVQFSRAQFLGAAAMQKRP